MGLPLYQLVRVAASGAVASAAAKVMAVLVATKDNDEWHVKFTDDANGAGTAVIAVSGKSYDGKFYDFTPLGGVIFGTAIYATIDQCDEVFVWIE